MIFSADRSMSGEFASVNQGGSPSFYKKQSLNWEHVDKPNYLTHNKSVNTYAGGGEVLDS
jgi:hypothetical protein